MPPYLAPVSRATCLAGSGEIVLSEKTTGIVLDERVANVVDIYDGVARRHPGVGVGLARVGAFLDAHRLHALGHHNAGNLLQIAKELLEPELKVEAVPQDQLGILCQIGRASCRER